MLDKLQSISFRTSKYVRPIQPWVCGHGPGKSCPLGPDRRGQCRSGPQCQPQKKGDRWNCTRSLVHGGKCESGPSPEGNCSSVTASCAPRRNWYWRRRTLGLLGFVTAIGLILVALSHANWMILISAGPLSEMHAPLENGDCQACHQSADVSRSNWLSLASVGHMSASDNDRCISCHLIGENPEGVHSLSSQSLSKLTLVSLENNRFRPTPLDLRVANSLFTTDQAVSCGTCHDEHGGRDQNLIQNTSEQCGFCHVQQFTSIDNGHPNFNEYPYSRRTRIKFDHLSHLQRHFLEPEYERKAPQQCGSCHQVDVEGSYMTARGFEQSCASCHEQQIVGITRATSTGVPILSVPGLDIETLNERGVNIGEWPEDSDAEFNAFFRYLLNRFDPNVQKHFAKLDDIDLFDLQLASDEQLEAVYHLIWLLKSFYFDLQKTGNGALVKLLSGEQDELPEGFSELAKLSGYLSPASIDRFLSLSLPNLSREYLDWSENGLYEFSLKIKPESIIDTASSNSDLGQQSSTASEDEEDWLENMLQEDESQEPVVEDDNPGEQDEDWLENMLAEEDNGSQENLVEPADSQSEEDWLASQLESTDDETSLLEGEDADLTDDEDWLSQALEEDENQESEIETTELVVEERPVSYEPLSAEERSMAGGWYVEYHHLLYRPSGHADGFLTAWLSLAGESQGKDVQAVFDSISEEDSPGACGKCHSVEAKGDAIVMNWTAKRVLSNHQGFQRFSHSAHFGMLNDSGCATCHQLSSESDPMAFYDGLDPHQFQSNFSDVDKNVCVACHNDSSDIGDCVTCHEYHIGEIVPAKISDSIASMQAN